MVRKITIGIDGCGELANGWARHSKILIDKEKVEEINIDARGRLDKKEAFEDSLKDNIRDNAKGADIPKVTNLGSFGDLLNESSVVIEIAGKDLSRKDGLDNLGLKALREREGEYKEKSKEERLVYWSQRTVEELTEDWQTTGKELEKEFIKLCFDKTNNPTGRIKQALPANIDIVWEKALVIGKKPGYLDKYYLWFPNENIITGNIALQIIQATSTAAEEKKEGLTKRFLTPSNYDAERVVSVFRKENEKFPTGINKIPIAGLHELAIPFLSMESILSAESIKLGGENKENEEKGRRKLKEELERVMSDYDLNKYYPQLLKEIAKEAGKRYKAGGTAVANPEVFKNIDQILEAIINTENQEEVFWSGYFHPFVPGRAEKEQALLEKLKQTEEDKKRGIYPGLYYIGGHKLKRILGAEKEIQGVDDLIKTDPEFTLPEKYFKVERNFIIEFLERFWGNKQIQAIFEEYAGGGYKIERGWPKGEDLMEKVLKGPRTNGIKAEEKGGGEIKIKSENKSEEIQTRARKSKEIIFTAGHTLGSVKNIREGVLQPEPEEEERQFNKPIKGISQYATKQGDFLALGTTTGFYCKCWDWFDETTEPPPLREFGIIDIINPEQRRTDSVIKLEEGFLMAHPALGLVAFSLKAGTPRLLSKGNLKMLKENGGKGYFVEGNKLRTCDLGGILSEYFQISEDEEITSFCFGEGERIYVGSNKGGIYTFPEYEDKTKFSQEIEIKELQRTANHLLFHTGNKIYFMPKDYVAGYQVDLSRLVQFPVNSIKKFCYDEEDKTIYVVHQKNKLSRISLGKEKPETLLDYSNSAPKLKIGDITIIGGKK